MSSTNAISKHFLKLITPKLRQRSYSTNVNTDVCLDYQPVINIILILVQQVVKVKAGLDTTKLFWLSGEGYRMADGQISYYRRKTGKSARINERMPR